jgi:hypothetical protein
MPTQKTAFTLLLLATTLCSSALAKTVVVPPMVARSVSAETVLSMTTLLASDLSFVGDFDDVTQLEKRPSGWSSGCLNSTSCLSSIARKNGAQALLGGSVTRKRDQYEIVLVYFDDGKIVRKGTARLDKDPMAVSDGLATHMRFVITGENPDAEAKANRVEGFDDVGFLDEEEEDDAPFVAPPVSRRIQTPPRRQARVIEDPEPVLADPVEDIDDIQFGSATDDIQVEDVSFGSAAGLIQVDEPAPAPVARSRYARDEDPIEDGGRRYDNLDDSAPAYRTITPDVERPRRRTQSSQNSMAGTVGLTGRAGYSKFQSLNFLTYGLEGSYQLNDTMALVAGLEAYSVRRSLDPTDVPVGEPAVVWNTILPFNLGMLYKPSSADIRPYVGAGVQAIPGYVKTEGAIALGLRARGGVDYILSDNFGLNLNVAAGLWTGEHFSEVQDDLEASGMVPQISGGTLFLF